nr:hypothetical protein [Pseudomonas sp. Leaf127]
MVVQVGRQGAYAGDAGIDLLACHVLLLGGAVDLAVHGRHLYHALAYAVQRLDQRVEQLRRLAATLLIGGHRLHDTGGVLLQGLDNAARFLDRVLGAPGQVAHLVGHHGKTAPVVTGTRGLDGRVQGQQVGLLGDVANDVQHTADAPALGRQLLDLLVGPGQLIDLAGDQGRGALDQPGAVLDGLQNATGCLRRRRGTAGDVLGGDGHLLHRRGNLDNVQPLPVHGRQVLLAGLDRTGCHSGRLAHRPLHLLDDRLPLIEKGIHITHHPSQLTGTGIVEPGGQVGAAVGHLPEHGCQGAQRADDPGRGHGHRRHQHDKRQDSQQGQVLAHAQACQRDQHAGQQRQADTGQANDLCT